MPATQRERSRVKIRSSLPWRRLCARRVVCRHVQGVDLYLPWGHLLPDYARARPTYGQNLVALAQGLQRAGGGPLPVLDIGANVGDSASQIMAGTDARVLCVEADPYWAGYLRRNVGGDARATIVEVLLTAGEGGGAGARPVRRGGTTRFVEQAGAGDLPALSVAQLRDLHPAFDRCRLVKSDTDGFDTTLVPAVAEVWKDRPPVLFFEFDPGLARLAGDRDPNQLWEQLSVLGYRRLAIWDNTGDPLGQLDTPDAAAAAARLEPRPVDLGYHFWDVAAWHRDDGEAGAVCDELMGEAYSDRGIWR